jgi:hypothetical protein
MLSLDAILFVRYSQRLHVVGLGFFDGCMSRALKVKAIEDFH